ncbi:MULTISPECIES: M1 family metallopeptidase [unclassified Mucilaginibacter]|uniref:M1 family metallopeptidase n=1 Tax=unclassified Mucilaginibacter TaxID=2617802 RepID=UPI002AC9EC76|nr:MULTISPECIES: M1 family metallopeptidase [unclassified Mucilaginibacter]MEB0261706.1 M1 family metallopeptidase [Mucilaginibacter sp. 10I4]MEB0278356.1 M1 family metallopeptidase [Mucilaginibacter sp. 10B2]MEB0301023.1 M1 family metallopeptidase [Mucilaginibacter sp. 5C4]WPX24001.1 M1 family metallopeptidase [Mucilaginibacter sp. 5C4]
MRKKIYLLLAAPLIAALSANAQAPGANVDVQHYRFAITLNDADNVIKGQATITAKFLKPATTLALDLYKKNKDGKGMMVSAIKESNLPVKYTQDSDKLVLNIKALKGSTHNYVITYQGIPTDGLIISTNQYKHRTFFGDNWATRARYWLPCVDDPADKASVEFLVTAPAKYKVVSNGLKVIENPLPLNKKLTHWSETAQLPTKVMVIGVADFAIANPGNPGGTPVYSYVFPEDKVEGLKNYAVAAKILPWFVKRIGAFPYKKLANVQSKTIFGGMENAGAIFYYEKSVNDNKGIEPLMAHEIAHQWFGDAVSEKTWWHVWLSEGFATYMTNLYMEGTYGADTLKSRLATDRDMIFGFEKKYRAPVVDSAYKGQMIGMLNANAYQKGGWVLHMLRRKIGDDAFWKGIQAYYKQYNGSNANTNDLRLVMEKASGKDLKPFFSQWLRDAGHPQLKITWHYQEKNKSLAVHINQLQEKPYQLTVEFMVDGKLYKSDIKGVASTITVPVASATPDVKADPNVNLLATFDTTNKPSDTKPVKPVN